MRGKEALRTLRMREERQRGSQDLRTLEERQRGSQDPKDLRRRGRKAAQDLRGEREGGMLRREFSLSFIERCFL